MRVKSLLFVVIITSFFVTCGSPLEKKELSSCSKIPGVPGPEDLDLINIDKKPTLIVSVHNRRNMESIGWIATIDLSQPVTEQKQVPLKTNYPENFRPHGISYAKVNGKDTLAVISHTLNSEKPHTIEIFERKSGNEWQHTKTLADPLLTGPNDIALNEKGEIFASNDRGPENKFMQYVNMIFKHGTADIAFYDGNKFINLNHKVVLGNGIFVRIENGIETLYRSVFSEKAISVFRVKRENGMVSLEFIKKIDLGSGPDNIIPDESGNLWVAGHPSTWKFLRHASSASNNAPSQVFKIDGKTSEVTNVYSNDGDEISAASTALTLGDRIYISQVFEDFLLTCTKP
jgi:hypothetical protein